MITIPDYGNKFILIAKALGMNLREFAKALSVAYSSLRNYTENSVMPPMDLLRKVLILAPNLNLMWLFFDQGDMFVESYEKRIVEMVLRENDLHRKLEAERERNMKIDTEELMQFMRRSHTMLGSLEQGFGQLTKDMAEIKEKMPISG